MYDNEFKNSIFLKEFHPHFCRPSWLPPARGGPPLPPLPRYELAICGRAVERRWSDVQRRSGPLEAAVSVYQQYHIWDCCSSPGVLTRTTGQPSSQRRRTVNVRHNWRSWWYADWHVLLTFADMVSWLLTTTPRSRALAIVVTVDDRTGMLLTVMFATCCLPPNQSTRWRLSSLDWDEGDWNSATLTRQQHSAKTDRRLHAAASVTGTLT